MISKIRDNLYLSSFADVTLENVSKFGINAILSVAPELQPLKIANVLTIHSGFPDVVEQVNGVDKVAANKLINLLTSGKRVVVHCKAGASRSPHVVTLALSSIENRDYDSVYKEIRNLHSRTIIYSMRQEMIDKGLIKKS
jgi:protein-tyrosine phosphatase